MLRYIRELPHLKIWILIPRGSRINLQYDFSLKTRAIARQRDSSTRSDRECLINLGIIVTNYGSAPNAAASAGRHAVQIGGHVTHL